MRLCIKATLFAPQQRKKDGLLPARKSACVFDIYFSGVQVYPQRENGDFTSVFWYREKSPFG